MTVRELVQNAKQLSIHDFEDFFSKIQSIAGEKLPQVLTQKEKNILKKINTSVPVKKKERFHYLIAQRDAETISEEEFKELLELTEEMEQYDLVRLKYIAELAELKNMVLPKVVDFFNIHPHLNA